MRTIIVFSTQNNQQTPVESAATTWGELKTDLTSKNVSYDGMKAMVRETKVTLDNNAAQLPVGNFTLFLTPDRVKSGL